MSETERKLTPFRLPEDLLTMLRERAKSEGRSQNRITEDALRAHLSGMSSAVPTYQQTAAPLPAGPAPIMDIATIPPITRPVDLGSFRWAWEKDADSLLDAHCHTLLLGGHGVGKSLYARRWAVERARPLWMATASQGIERDTLEGAYYPTTNGQGVGIRAIDGILTSALREGGLLLLEELTGIPADVSMRLLSALNSHVGEFDVAYRGAAVPVHPDFLLLATANPPGKSYKGTDKLNAALLSRFTVFEIPFPSYDELTEYLRAIQSPDHLREPLARLATQVYQTHTKGDVANYISPRELALYLRARAAGISDALAYQTTVLAKFDATQRDAIAQVWQMLRPQEPQA